ncbi:nucleophile aminohydrolase [Jimgerdemannia flammicorona]|uniref:Nucleophile aminohydrolase n=1 Tax=Jimgerdemannia flammicorona TaxID=994334 RepID=A0A433Q494_9FUNG|nr:nucleophile aminohydrolase [Jimgerdemannia flammicorona]
MTADSKTIIDHSRVEAQNYQFIYNKRIKIESIMQTICDLVLQSFGMVLLIAGIDKKRPQLFYADLLGIFMYDWEEYYKSLTLKEAKTLSLKMLKIVIKKKLNNTNIQLISIILWRKFHVYSE